MIISASRRTDIPAFYTEWFMRRIHEGFCTMVNPFNRNQVSYISLKPEDVDVIIFWTKNPAPLLPYLSDLDRKGYKYYFQYTINGYGPIFESHVPNLADAVSTFKELSKRIGPEKVIWRYDPIVLSNRTGIDYHKKQFQTILDELKSFTRRTVISVVDDYRKASFNFKRLQQTGIHIDMIHDTRVISDLLHFMKQATDDAGTDIYSCAEVLDFTEYGISAGKCVDDNLIRDIFSIDVSKVKDKSQRQECGCVVSKDVGQYETCFHDCAYCYAGTSQQARRNKEQHNPESPSLLGWYHAEPKTETKKKKAA